MPITLDFDHVFPDEGEYDLECIKCEASLDKNGKDLWKMQWSIIAPTNPGFTVFDSISFTPAAMSMAQQRLEAITKLPFRDAGMTLDERDFPGLKVRAYCVHDEYDGVVKLQIKRMYPYAADSTRPFPQLEDTVPETPWSVGVPQGEEQF